ncbi:MAG: SEC-C domain-containing protein [Proteobacteria bacterium]|nr:SEC-C domain-containing protein [Pseudomonadota bacterium]
MIEDKAYDVVDEFLIDKTPLSQWDTIGLKNRIKKIFNCEFDLDAAVKKNLDAQQLSEELFNHLKTIYDQRENQIGQNIIRQIERHIILQTVDTRWKEHLLSMDHLKEGIGLRGYAQQDPLRVYQKEGFDMFQGLMDRVKEEIVDILFKIQITTSANIEEIHKPDPQNLTFSHSDGSSVRQPQKRSSDKIQRNDPCPCGSGKKYKKCCMS